MEARTTKFNLNKQTNNRRRSDPKGTIGVDVPCPGTTPLEVAVLKGHTAIADLGEETVRQNQQDRDNHCYPSLTRMYTRTYTFDASVIIL